MRLTLRTLLAYMDDILEPEDREDLRAKIEHSEFASDLLHRSRDVMRRLRLGAVAVADARKGMDANSVAEYLDNTMPPEQVADFERLCLESDMQLAEVASCHQILTMVLGEPADVRPDARARMYDIPAEADLAAIPATDVEDGPPPAALPRTDMPHIDVTLRPAAEVPDYLRGSFFERHSGKLIVAALLLIAGAAVLLWPTDETPVPQEVAQNGIEDHITPPVIDPGDEPGQERPANGESGPADQDLSESPRYPAEPATGEDADAADAMPADDGRDPPLEGSDIAGIPPLPADLADQARQADAGPEPPADSAASPENGVRLPSTTERTAATDTLPEAPVPAAEEPGDTATDGGQDDQRSAAATAATAGATVAPAEPPDGTPDGISADQGLALDGSATDDASAGDDTTATSTAAVPSSPSQPEHVATYISRGEMLLRYSDQTDGWMRLPPLSQLHEGDRLLALPASRPLITLPSTNLSVQLQPATRVVLAAEDTAGMPNLGGDMAPAGLNVQYGRVVMFNPAQSGNWVAVQLGLLDAVYVLELDGDSMVAVEVRRELPAGVDPLENSGTLVADLFVTSGQVRWQTSSSATAQTIDPLAHWQIRSRQVGPIEPLPAEPSWISEDTVPQSDRLAVPVVEPALKTDRPARVSLVELGGEPIVQRRREVKSLVTRASVHIGEFEPFVKALNDSSQNQVWDEHIATLRGAMALGPQVAERVREAFRNYKGDVAGDELFRLLWGYSKEQLDSGALEELIEYLDHESLDFRVLAFNNLHRATGKRLHYLPHDSRQQREGPIREWRTRLMDKDLEVQPQGTGD